MTDFFGINIGQLVQIGAGGTFAIVILKMVLGFIKTSKEETNSFNASMMKFAEGMEHFSKNMEKQTDILTKLMYDVKEVNKSIERIEKDVSKCHDRFGDKRSA